MKKNISYWKREDGAVAIFMALAMTVLVGFSAFAVDQGLYYHNKSKLQTACDSAALAAAQKLPSTTAAAATAKEYIVKNGFTVQDVIITFENNNRAVRVTSAKQQKTYLANVLGIKHLDYQCTAAAGSVKQSLGGVFDFSIYSGNVYPAEPGKTSFSVRLQNELVFTGLTNWVWGNVHSNFQISAHTSNFAAIGQAVGTVKGVNIFIKREGVDYIPMPDFSAHKAQIKAEAIAAGQYYSGNFDQSNASSLNLNSPVYVEGNANVGGITFSGAGCLYAEGKIYATGASASYLSDSKICFYSGYTSGYKADAAIDFSGSEKDFTGMLYAPNGSILVTGSNYRFNGCVIGRLVDVSGSNKHFFQADITESFPYATTSTSALLS